VILPAVATVSTHSSGIHDLVWSPRTPNLIATASNDKTLQIWDVTRAPACSPLANSNTVGQPSHGTGSAGADLPAAKGGTQPGDT
jgi:WD40 repeat protein